MTSPFVAEIRIFPFGFAPVGWAACDGQILPLSQNTALFSLLGTTYGGDGKSNFALPNMQARAPMQPGQGPGLSLHDLGEAGGEATVSLLASEMPAHSHTPQTQAFPANLAIPSPQTAFARSQPGQAYKSTTANIVQFSANAIGSAGGNQPHNNLMPYLTMNFCIALQGIYPPRT